MGVIACTASLYVHIYGMNDLTTKYDGEGFEGRHPLIILFRDIYTE